MVIQVNQELCTGCGVCMDECPVGAIHLEDRRAVIDDVLCTQCEACIDACPSGAITILAEPARRTSIIALPASDSRVDAPLSRSEAPERVATPARGLAPVAGAALAFLGSEVAPRLLDVLMGALERRLAQPSAAKMAPTKNAPAFYDTPDLARGNRGKRRQARRRGGRNGNGNRKGRR